MSTINQIILNANGQLNEKQLALIKSAHNKALERTEKELGRLPNTDIVFLHNPEYVIPEIGVSGETYNAHTIMMWLDKEFDFTEEDVTRTLCHELNHTVRMKELGFPNLLFEKIISEGLADQFEVELEPDLHPITYRKDLDPKDLLERLKSIREISKSDKYDYFAWFFGDGDAFPRWLGYTIGNYIIDKYCAKYKTKPSDLTRKPASEFEPFVDYLIKDFDY